MKKHKKRMYGLAVYIGKTVNCYVFFDERAALERMRRSAKHPAFRQAEVCDLSGLPEQTERGVSIWRIKTGRRR